MARLGDVIEQIRGVSYKPSDLKDTLNDNSVILLRANNIQDGKIVLDDVLYVSKSKVNASQYLRRGDILVCTSSGSKELVGKAASVDEDLPAVFGAFCKVVRPKIECCKYVGHFFQSPYYRNYISAASAGANINNLRNEHIADLHIPLPPLDKQRKIAAVLDKVSSLIVKRKQQLDKLDELVKSRFIEMFGDINVNDKGWTIQPLGELCTIVRGGSPRPIEKFLGGDVPWIKIGDATDGESIYLHSTKEHIIREGVSKSRMVKAGSLIFANCGVSLGFARIITFDGCIHDGWLAMEDIDARLDKVFLLQALNQMTEHFRKIAPAGTQPNLNTAIMKAYKQIIPPMKLQKDFISFVEQTDKSKLAIQKSLEKLEILKKALMQKYFG